MERCFYMARTSLSEIEQRNNRTLEYMHNHSSVTVEELAQYLQVSTVTVRRDLNYLLNEKMVLRTSAGHYALNEDPSFDVALFQRYSAHHLEKTAIARAALDLIPSAVGLKAILDYAISHSLRVVFLFCIEKIFKMRAMQGFFRLFFSRFFILCKNAFLKLCKSRNCCTLCILM